MERLTKTIEDYESYEDARLLGCKNDPYCEGFRDGNCAHCPINLIAIEKLSKYEDAEEQGRLIEFPVSIGQHLWMVDDYGIIRDLTVHELVQSADGQTMLVDSAGVRTYYSLSHIGENIFLTWDEAQARLKELGNEMTKAKAILVLNHMPEKCDNCPLYEYNYSNDYTPICNYEDREILSNDYKKRPNWCPLKELPEKEEEYNPDIHPCYEPFDAGYIEGWNECLGEIEKEGNL